MKGRLLAVILIVVVLGLLLAGGAIAVKTKNIIGPDVWTYLWPSIVAVGFLALSIVFLVTGGFRWLWPLVTGFVVQTIGIVLLALHEFTGKWRSWWPLWYTLGAVGFVLFVMLVVWIIIAVRARWLERKMVQGMGGTGGVDPQKIQQIRNDMQEALNLLKKSGRGRTAIYELPWFLVIGRPQAGKTVAIKNSGLGLPVRRDWVKGVGGTHTCDWFFTNDLIFLDTPGKWVTEGTGPEGKGVWTELLRLLRRYRGRRPLDGLVVVVPADDLLSKTDDELQEQASNVREVIDLLHAELKFRFPVYVLVSKSDLVEGFIDFFRGLPAQRRHEILGWSWSDPNEGEARRLIPKGFARVLRRLQAYRLEMLARIASRARARKLFFFTEEFKRLERPLAVFADILFLHDPANEPPVFRGFYFTSGTQGEGSPLGQAMNQLAKTLGVRVTQPQASAEEEPKRSYFLLELFRNLMVGDEGLVSRTARDWLNRRRDTALVAFLPAAAACLLLMFALLSFVLNWRIYRNVKEELPSIVANLAAYRRDTTPENLGQTVQMALEETERIRNYHKKMTGFTLLRSLGMRRPGLLADQTLEVFRREFNQTVLTPTLKAALAYDSDGSNPCTDRTDVFYSVVWLRKGRIDERSDDLRGFGKVWGMEGDEAERVRRGMLYQFTYLKENGGSNAALLPGFSLAQAAGSIKDGCSDKDANSSLELYKSFQRQCGAPGPTCEIYDCYKKLDKAVGFQEEDYARLRGHFQGLNRDLRTLEKVEPGADVARRLFGSIPVPSSEGSDCLKRFNSSVMPQFAKYLEKQRDLIDECKEEWRSNGKSKTIAIKVVKTQSEALKDTESELRDLAKEFNEDCRDKGAGYFSIDPVTLFGTAAGYRRIACVEEDEPCSAGRRGVVRAGGGGGGIPAPVSAGGGEEGAPRRAAVPASPVRTSGLSWFEPPSHPAGGYTSAGWENRKRELDDELQYARELPGAQQDSELASFRQKVESYADNYYRVWKDYLQNLRLRSGREIASSWLAALSRTSEYESLLRPAAQAAKVGDTATDPNYQPLARKLQGLSNLGSFVDGDLNQYLGMLADISKDLKQCEEDPGFWREYRSQVQSRQRGNSLVEARDWCERNAGVAEGSLRTLLLTPLDVASDFIQSPNLTRASWEQMAGLYASISPRFPFAGESSEEVKLVDLKDLQAILGGKVGAVPALHEGDTSRLSQPARDWIESAMGLSRIFYGDGKDDLQPLQVRLSIGSLEFEPADLGEKFRLKAVDFYLGESAEFRWEEDKAKPQAKIKKLSFDLFGPNASTFSSLKVTLEEKKGVFGRTFGSDWKVMDPKEAAGAEGPWSPVRLLGKGIEGGTPGPEESALDLRYEMNLAEGEKKPKKVRLNVKAEGEGLARVIALMKDGLPRPPISAGGE